MKALGTALVTLVTALIAHIPCCGPAVLLALGGTSATAGWLEPLHEYRPYLIALSLIQLSLGFWLAYRQPKKVCPVHGENCQDERKKRSIRIATIWVVAAVVVSIAVWPEPDDHDHAGHNHSVQTARR